MERHGKALASGHELDPGRRPGRGRDRLLARLTQNESALVAAGELLKAAVTAGSRIAPAGEWLLDNFHLIEEQVRTAKRHLPREYSRELPRLRQGPSAGMPRVYDIALEAIAHGDGRLDGASLRRFVAAYQELAPLKLGELWAIPIMLRLALLENLRRVAGWMYRLAVESLLGLRREGDKLRLVPRPPATIAGNTSSSCEFLSAWRAMQCASAHRRRSRRPARLRR